jgi:hypothetical protein
MAKKNEMPAAKVGRLTYSETLGEEICARVATGEDIMSICESEGMPAHTTLHRWRDKYPEFGAAYARARALSGEAAEARIQRIMNDARAGKIDAQTARVLIDAEKWLASKRAPRTHGDRVEVEHSGTVGPMQVIVNVVRADPTPKVIDVSPANDALSESAGEHLAIDNSNNVASL